MGKIFNIDSPLMRTLSRLADFMILNVLAVVCALPVVTLGASAAGLYTAMQKLVKDEGQPTRDFFRGFRSNFKQATLLWLILLALGALIAVGLVFYAAVDWSAGRILYFVMIFFAVVWCLFSCWVFPLQAKFYNTIGGTLRNALLCSVAFLWRSVAMAVLQFLPLVLALFFPYQFLMGGVIWLLIWFSLAAYLQMRLLKKPYSVMMPKEDEENLEET